MRTCAGSSIHARCPTAALFDPGSLTHPSMLATPERPRYRLECEVPSSPASVKHLAVEGGLWFSALLAAVIRAPCCALAENPVSSTTPVRTPAIPRYQLTRAMTEARWSAANVPGTHSLTFPFHPGAGGAGSKMAW